MSSARHCGICGELLTDRNDSREHVIPNALGGRRVVRGFLCGPCNNQTGDEWDAPLVRKLQPFCILLGVRRTRGSVRPMQFDMAKFSLTDQHSRTNSALAAMFAEENIEKVVMYPDGRMTPVRPTHSEEKVGSTRRIRLICRSREEAHKRLRDLRRKYPQIDDDDAEVTVTEERAYVPHFLGWELRIGESEEGRAITKAALALAVDAGIIASECEKAMKYFEDDDESCLSFFYDYDPITNRVEGMPLHAVYVQGDPEDGHLIGYVELFGCLRFGVCLSATYRGGRFSSSYAIDPTTGKEEDVEIDFRCGPEQIQAMREGFLFPSVEIRTAIEKIMPTILRLAEERERERVIKEAVEHASRNLNVGEDRSFEPRHAKRIAELIMEIMTPYLIHQFEKNRI